MPFLKGHHGFRTKSSYIQGGKTISIGRKRKFKEKGFLNSVETREKMSRVMKGKVPWNYGIKVDRTKYPNMGRFGARTKEEKEKISKSKQASVLTPRGEKCSRWKGGITPLNMKIRKSLEYKEWRKKVFERDNYTCQICGIQSGENKKVYLHADHIKPFAYFPKLRFILTNGRTLCKPCHIDTETYGNKYARNFC